MGWLIFLGLALVTGGALWRFGRMPKGTIELLGAALCLAVAGYAWQGTPSLSGKPTPAPEDAHVPDSEFAKERTKLLGQFGADFIVERAQLIDRGHVPVGRRRAGEGRNASLVGGKSFRVVSHN